MSEIILLLLALLFIILGWSLRGIFEDRTYNITINTKLIDHIIEELKKDNE